MARPFDQISDRPPTPPLSPSTSSGSSRSSSAPSLSPSPLSSLLPRDIDIDDSRPGYPDPQPLTSKRRDPSTELGLMPHSHDDDAMMLDDWEEVEHERLERDPGTPLEPHSELVSFPFQQLESSSARSSESSYSQVPSGSHQSSQLSQTFNSLPSPDVIDVTKLARQDQPPPAYENVDEHPSSNVSRPSPSPLATRAPRPLPMPPLNSLSRSSSSHSVNPAADIAPVDSYGNSNLAPQSSPSPDRPNPALSTGRPFHSSVGTSESSAAPFGLLHPLDHSSSRDWLDRYSAGISPLPSQSPFSTLTPRMASEPGQQLISAGSSNQDPSWTSNQSFSGSQQGTSAASGSSRPVSMSGSIQTLSPPPPYCPSEASSSRGASYPLCEYIDEMRYTRRPPPVAPAPSSRGLPPPAPPTILDPPPARSNSTRSSRAPHEPFLSDAPAPPDSWITVETTQVEYRLVARLPGFRRDAITLAARRRRVLHVVADSWEPGGGHFERRISFGYDADLSQVRAEFDGEILRVIVPRRAPMLTWYGDGEACE